MMVSTIDNREQYTLWISMNKFTYANMTLDNPKIASGSNLKLRKDQTYHLLTILKFQTGNKNTSFSDIFCLGNLLNYEYEDLRFECA